MSRVSPGVAGRYGVVGPGAGGHDRAGCVEDRVDDAHTLCWNTDPDRWQNGVTAWLKARGVEWAAELIPDLTNLATESETLPPTVADLGEIELILEEEEITP